MDVLFNESDDKFQQIFDHLQCDESEEKKIVGESRQDRLANIDRQSAKVSVRLYWDYFSEQLTYPKHNFWEGIPCFSNFTKICRNVKYICKLFNLKKDVVEKHELNTLQKCTVAMKLCCMELAEMQLMII